MASILIVEDQAIISMVLQEILLDEGYEVLVAEDGNTALGILTEASPDLVMTDLRLPYLGGAEMVRLMRQDPRLSSVPVIIVTGSLREELPPADTYQAFIPKPFDLSEVLQVVAEVLGRVPVASN